MIPQKKASAQPEINTPVAGGDALSAMRYAIERGPAAVDRDALYTCALIELHAGHSVIPVWGDADPARAKMPVFSWGQYQVQRPTEGDLQTWFKNGNAGGLALVCGRVSNLMVLEFDDPAAAAAFADACPDLLRTRTIISAGRRLPHYYYRPPAGADWRGRGAAGRAELRGSGQYVLTFPTSISGRAYTVAGAYPIMEPDAEQWQRLLDFLAGFGSRPKSDPDPLPEPEPEPAPTRPDAAALIATYHQWLTRTGSRNEALYRAARAAHNAGWLQADAENALLLPFVTTAAPAGHAPETDAARATEGRRTVASAFAAPRQPLTAAGKGLPTAARERLLQAGQVATARTLDALYMAGWEPGRAFTEREAVTAVAPFGLSRSAVRAALTRAPASPSSGGINLYAFDIVTEPRPNAPNCCAVKGCKTRQIKRGPAARQFVLPAPADVCAHFGVDDRRSDPLAADDLKTAAAYRKAVNRALIRRRPGQYSKGWLADRVGVSRSTLHRYVKQDAHIVVSKQVSRQPVTRATLALVPEELEKGDWGRWLEDSDCKRYPARRVIAARLLDMGRAVVLCTQECNRYDYDPDPTPAQANGPRWADRPHQANGPYRADRPLSGQWPHAPQALPDPVEVARRNPPGEGWRLIEGR